MFFKKQILGAFCLLPNHFALTFYKPVTIDDNSLHNDDSDSFSEAQLCTTSRTPQTGYKMMTKVLKY